MRQISYLFIHGLQGKQKKGSYCLNHSDILLQHILYLASVVTCFPHYESGCIYICVWVSLNNAFCVSVRRAFIIDVHTSHRLDEDHRDAALDPQSYIILCVSQLSSVREG